VAAKRINGHEPTCQAENLLTVEGAWVVKPFVVLLNRFSLKCSDAFCL